MDYVALYQMSLRSFFWKVDGRQGLDQFRTGGTVGAGVYLIGLVLAYIPAVFALDVITLIPRLLIMGLASLMPNSIFGGGWMIASEIVTLFVLGFTTLFSFKVVFNKEKLNYNLHFTKSNWWLNTGVLPSQIKKDKGLYGEYVATIMTEACLRRGSVYGRVFNNVVVPKRDGDFTEVDLISVNECGIHVIEAKARGGAFYGGFLADTWQQHIGSEVHEMENPVIQNQNHKNYMLDYLYSCLPEGPCRARVTNPYNCVNVVVFANLEVEEHLDKSKHPVSFFFGNIEGANGYETLDIRSAYGVRFSRDDVDRVCAVLDQISHYTREQLDSMIYERQRQYDSGAVKPPQVCYFYARVQYVEQDNTVQEAAAIWRMTGQHLDVLDNNGVFTALPSATFIEMTPYRRTLNEVYADINGLPH